MASLSTIEIAQQSKYRDLYKLEGLLLVKCLQYLELRADKTTFLRESSMIFTPYSESQEDTADFSD